MNKLYINKEHAKNPAGYKFDNEAGLLHFLSSTSCDDSDFLANFNAGLEHIPDPNDGEVLFMRIDSIFSRKSESVSCCQVEKLEEMVTVSNIEIKDIHKDFIPTCYIPASFDGRLGLLFPDFTKLLSVMKFGTHFEKGFKVPKWPKEEKKMFFVAVDDMLSGIKNAVTVVDTSVDLLYLFDESHLSLLPAEHQRGSAANQRRVSSVSFNKSSSNHRTPAIPLKPTANSACVTTIASCSSIATVPQYAQDTTLNSEQIEDPSTQNSTRKKRGRAKKSQGSPSSTEASPVETKNRNKRGKKTKLEGNVLSEASPSSVSSSQRSSMYIPGPSNWSEKLGVGGRRNKKDTLPHHQFWSHCNWKSTWSLLKESCGWQCKWSKLFNRYLDEREFYLTPGADIEQWASNNDPTITQIENLEYFCSMDALQQYFARHHHLVLLQWDQLWARLSGFGWKLNSEDQEIFSFFYPIENFLKNPVQGIHFFLSADAVMRYISRFPYLLLEYSVLIDTLIKFKWPWKYEHDPSNNKTKLFLWPSAAQSAVQELYGEKSKQNKSEQWLKLNDVRERLWLFPTVLFSYLDPVATHDRLLRAIQVPPEEDKELRVNQEKQGYPISPLTKQVYNKPTSHSSYRMVQLENLCGLLSETSFSRVHYVNLRLGGKRGDSLVKLRGELHKLLTCDAIGWTFEKAVWFERKWYQHEFVYLSPWGKDKVEANEGSSLVLGKDYFWNLYDLVDHVKCHSSLVLTFPGGYSPLGSDQPRPPVDITKSKLSDRIQWLVLNSTDAFKEPSFLDILKYSGWNVVSIRNKDIYIPRWSKNKSITASNIHKYIKKRDYFETADDVMDHITTFNDEVGYFPSPRGRTVYDVDDDDDSADNLEPDISTRDISNPTPAEDPSEASMDVEEVAEEEENEVEEEKIPGTYHLNNYYEYGTEESIIAEQLVNKATFGAIYPGLKNLGWRTCVRKGPCDSVYWVCPPWTMKDSDAIPNPAVPCPVVQDASKLVHGVDYFVEKDDNHLAVRYLETRGFTRLLEDVVVDPKFKKLKEQAAKKALKPIKSAKKSKKPAAPKPQPPKPDIRQHDPKPAAGRRAGRRQSAGEDRKVDYTFKEEWEELKKKVKAGSLDLQDELAVWKELRYHNQYWRDIPVKDGFIFTKRQGLREDNLDAIGAQQGVDYFRSLREVLCFVHYQGCEFGDEDIVSNGLINEHQDDYFIPKKSPVRPIRRAIEPSEQLVRLESNYADESPLVHGAPLESNEYWDDSLESLNESAHPLVVELSKKRPNVTLLYGFLSQLSPPWSLHQLERENGKTGKVYLRPGKDIAALDSLIDNEDYFTDDKKLVSFLKEQLTNPFEDCAAESSFLMELNKNSPNINRLFGHLKKLDQPWTYVYSSVLSTGGVMYLRPNRDQADPNLILNEDYFTSQAALIDYLRVQYGIQASSQYVPSTEKPRETRSGRQIDRQANEGSQSGFSRRSQPLSPLVSVAGVKRSFEAEEGGLEVTKEAVSAGLRTLFGEDFVTDANIQVVLNNGAPIKKPSQERKKSKGDAPKSLANGLYSTVLAVANAASSLWTSSTSSRAHTLTLQQSIHQAHSFLRRGEGVALPFAEIPSRETETKQILKLVTASLEKGKGETVYIAGIPAMGKTLTVTTVLQQVRESRETALGISNDSFQGRFDCKDEAQLGYRVVRMHGSTVAGVEQGYRQLAESLGLWSSQQLKHKDPMELVRKLFRTPADKLGSRGQFKGDRTTVPMTVLVIDEADFHCCKNFFKDLAEIASGGSSSLLLLALGNVVTLVDSLNIHGHVSRLTFVPYDQGGLNRILTCLTGSLFQENAGKLLCAKVAANHQSDVRTLLLVADQCISRAEKELQEQEADEAALNTVLSGPEKNFVTMRHVVAEMQRKDEVSNYLNGCATHLQLLVVALMVHDYHSDPFRVDDALRCYNSYAAEKHLKAETWEDVYGFLGNLQDYSVVKSNKNGGSPGKIQYRLNISVKQLQALPDLQEMFKNDLKRWYDAITAEAESN